MLISQTLHASAVVVVFVMQQLYCKGCEIAMHLSIDTLSMLNDLDDIDNDVINAINSHSLEEKRSEGLKRTAAIKGITKNPIMTSLNATDNKRAFVFVCKHGVRDTAIMSTRLLTIVAHDNSVTTIA